MTLTLMSRRGEQLLAALRMNLELIKEHEKVSPAEVDVMLAMLTAHLRSLRPQALLIGGAL